MIISSEKYLSTFFNPLPPSYDRNYHRGKCLQLWTAPNLVINYQKLKKTDRPLDPFYWGRLILACHIIYPQARPTSNIYQIAWLVLQVNDMNKENTTSEQMVPKMHRSVYIFRHISFLSDCNESFWGTCLCIYLRQRCNISACYGIFR